MLREAILIEPNSCPLFWVQASASLFLLWPKLFIENKDQSDELEDKPADSALLSKLLFPYVKINRDFMSIIISLEQTGLSASVLKAATNHANQDLLRMIRCFKVITRNLNNSQLFNPTWVDSLNKIEVALTADWATKLT